MQLSLAALRTSNASARVEDERRNEETTAEMVTLAAEVEDLKRFRACHHPTSKAESSNDWVGETIDVDIPKLLLVIDV